jgi:hypothetical protein
MTPRKLAVGDTLYLVRAKWAGGSYGLAGDTLPITKVGRAYYTLAGGHTTGTCQVTIGDLRPVLDQSGGYASAWRTEADFLAHQALLLAYADLRDRIPYLPADGVTAEDIRKAGELLGVRAR